MAILMLVALCAPPRVLFPPEGGICMAPQALILAARGATHIHPSQGGVLFSGGTFVWRRGFLDGEVSWTL